MKLKPNIGAVRKSASLILTLDSGAGKNRILTIKRKVGMSFGGVLVFPGGMCQNIDNQLARSNNFPTYAKITAIRQTLQQTGILAYPPNIDDSLIKKIQEKNILESDLLQKVIGQLWENHLHLIRPAVRFVTPQFPQMKRFDCIFYVLDGGVPKKNLRGDSLENLQINLSQSSQYFWKEPQEYVQLCKEKVIEMAPPQKIIMNCFSNMQKISQKDSFTSQVWNLKEEDCLEPLIGQFDARGFLMVGDEDYDFKSAIENEPASDSRDEIVQFLNRKVGQKNKGNRRVCKFSGKQGAEVRYQSNLMMSPRIFDFLNANPLSNL